MCHTNHSTNGIQDESDSSTRHTACTQSMTSLTRHNGTQGVKLLACFYRHQSALRGVYEAKSVRLCQAVVMAGCRPSKDEIDEFEHSVVSGKDVITQYVELLS